MTGAVLPSAADQQMAWALERGEVIGPGEALLRAIFGMPVDDFGEPGSEFKESDD